MSQRMTAEDVKAAREAQLKKLSHQSEEQNTEMYDTTKLDISGIVGFKDELDDQFEMIEKMGESDASSENGGDR